MASGRPYRLLIRERGQEVDRMRRRRHLLLGALVLSLGRESEGVYEGCYSAYAGERITLARCVGPCIITALEGFMTNGRRGPFRRRRVRGALLVTAGRGGSEAGVCRMEKTSSV